MDVLKGIARHCQDYEGLVTKPVHGKGNQTSRGSFKMESLTCQNLGAADLGNVLGEERGKVSLEPVLSRRQKDFGKAHTPHYRGGKEGCWPKSPPVEPA